VKCEQVQRLYDEYRGPKELMYINSDHHEVRDETALNTIMQFLGKKFSAKKISQNSICSPKSEAVLKPSNSGDKKGITRLSSKEGDMLKHRFVKSDRH
jgi:hypothetical protein